MRRLPGYMVPAHYIELSEFPLTQSGKVDRSALPGPSLGVATNGYRTPTTDVERLLAGLWETLPGKASVGIEDHFFELGGDSIKALQFLAMLRERGYEGSVNALFEAPSICEFSRRVTKSRREIPQEPAVGPVDLTPIQWWLLEQDSSVVHHFNQSVLRFREAGFCSD